PAVLLLNLQPGLPPARLGLAHGRVEAGLSLQAGDCAPHPRRLQRRRLSPAVDESLFAKCGLDGDGAPGALRSPDELSLHGPGEAVAEAIRSAQQVADCVSPRRVADGFDGRQV